MKKTLFLFITLMLFLSSGWADEIDDALPENTGLQIRNNTRQMVRSGISEADAIQLTRAMLQHRFQERYTIQAQNLLTETIQSGLPTEPMINKALEGMAKNKPADAIVKAMQHTQSRYAYAFRKAQEVSNSSNSQSALGQTIAQGMGAGLEDKDIDRIVTQLQIRTRQMTQNKAEELSLQTFLIARTMARLGVGPNKVSDVVAQALQQQFTARQMQQLRSRFSSQAQQVSPNQLANQLSHNFGQDMENGNPGTSNDTGSGSSGSNQGSDNGSDGGEGNGSGNSGSSGSSNAEGSGGNTGSGSGNSGGNTGGSGGDAGGSGNSGGGKGNR